MADPEHTRYEKLGSESPLTAQSRSALIRRLVGFERAAQQAG